VARATVQLATVLLATPVVGVTPAAAADHWVAPVPVTVADRFDPPDQPWLAGHRGVDLLAAAGTVVRAAGAGEVSFAGPLAGRGVVVVVHGPLRTTYEPVTATVSVGDQVAPGEPIGVLEAAVVHCGGRACLHWGLLRGTAYLDPLTLLGPTRVRLLPFSVGEPAPTAASVLPPPAARAGRAVAVVTAPVAQAAARPAALPAARSPAGPGTVGAAVAALTAAGVVLAGGAVGRALRRRAPPWRPG
jgi:biotin carboxyl carrier protein